jgi:hypothetical protein
MSPSWQRLLKWQAGCNKLMRSKMNNPYAKEKAKKWKDGQMRKEGMCLLLQQANQKVNLGLESCKKCANP